MDDYYLGEMLSDYQSNGEPFKGYCYKLVAAIIEKTMMVLTRALKNDIHHRTFNSQDRKFHFAFAKARCGRAC